MRPLNQTGGDLSRTRKVSSAQVREIRKRFSRDTEKQLAKEFGVHVNTIRNIASRKTWKGVD